MAEPVPDAFEAPAAEIVVTVKLLVANACAGAIIGKSGQNVRAMRESSGAKIQISDYLSPHATDERLIMISGSKDAVTKGYRLIAEEIQKAEAAIVAASSYGAAPDARSVVTVTRKFLVSNRQAGAIIGARGQGITSIREESGAQLQVHSKQDMPPGVPDRLVNLTGSAEAVEKGQYLILDKLIADARPEDGHKEGGERGPRPDAAMSTQIGQASFVFEIPDQTVGAIIGRGGTNVSILRSATGCQIRIDTKPPGVTRDTRRITLIGLPDQISRAHQLILTQVASALQESGPGMGAGMGAGRGAGMGAGMGGMGGAGMGAMGAMGAMGGMGGMGAGMGAGMGGMGGAGMGAMGAMGAGMGAGMGGMGGMGAGMGAMGGAGMGAMGGMQHGAGGMSGWGASGFGAGSQQLSFGLGDMQQHPQHPPSGGAHHYGASR